MKNFLDDNKRMGALMTILVLAVGSISIAETNQFVIGQDGNTLKNFLGGCIYNACKDTKITGNVTDGNLARCIYAACKDTLTNGGTTGGGVGEPTPNTATLVVFKFVRCSSQPCADPSDFPITVTGNNPLPDSFPGSIKGTIVTLGPGDYTVSEQTDISRFTTTFQGNCVQDSPASLSASGNIQARQIRNCLITNTEK